MMCVRCKDKYFEHLDDETCEKSGQLIITGILF